MKKPFILLLSTILLLAGCGDKAESNSQAQSSVNSPESQKSSSSESSNSSSLSSKSSISESSSESSSSLEEKLSEKNVTIKELESISTTAKEKKSLIANGSIRSVIKDSWSSNDYTTTFELGSNEYGDEIHYKEKDYADVVYDIYVFQDGENSIGKIKKDGEGEYSKYDSSITEVGFPFAIEPLFGFEVTPAGTESLLESLVKYAEKDANKDFKATLKDNEYAISFGYLTGLSASSVVTNEITMKLGTQGEIASLKVISKEYSSGYLLDDETVTFTLSDSAKPSNTYQYEITQATATRTFELPFNPNDFYYSSFDLQYKGETVGNTLTLDKGTFYDLYFANILPATANYEFDSFEFKEIGEAASGMELEVLNLSSDLRARIETYDAKEGTYQLVLSSKKVTKNLTINVQQPQPKAIDSVTYFKQANESSYTSDLVQNDKVSTFVNSPIYLLPSISPTAADQGIRYSLLETAGATLVKEEKDLFGYGETKTYYKLLGASAGTYHVMFTSIVNPSVSKTIEVVVEEKPSFATLLSKIYIQKGAAYGWQAKFTFTPDSEDDTKGTAIIATSATSSGEYTYAISPNEDGLTYALAFTYVSGKSYSYKIIINMDYSLHLYLRKENTGIMYEYTELADISARYSGSESTGTYNAEFGIAIDGTGSLTVNDNEYEFYEYVQLGLSVTANEDGTYSGFATTTDDDPFTTFPLEFTIQEISSKLTLSFSIMIDGKPYNFKLEKQKN